MVAPLLRRLWQVRLRMRKQVLAPAEAGHLGSCTSILGSFRPPNVLAPCSPMLLWCFRMLTLRINGYTSSSTWLVSW